VNVQVRIQRNREWKSAQTREGRPSRPISTITTNKEYTVAVNSPTLKSRDSMSSDGDTGRSTELEVADEAVVELLLTERRRGWRYEL